MTIAQFPVPPIVKNVTVRAAPARAFALFADDLARWWPLSRVHTGPDPADCAIEPRVGGRVFERSADGRETAWGTVLAYDPPHRLAFSWIVELPAGVGATGRDEDAIVRAIPNAGICIAEIGRLLDDRTWLAGDALSLADLLLAPQLSMFAQAPEDAQILQEHENLNRWLARIEARPSMQATTWDRLLERVAAAA
jgi:uncharacterized protein YndB with AHSA1/START domain